MKYSIPMKFLAIFLTALCLVAAVTGVLGIVQAESYRFYSRSFEEWLDVKTEAVCEGLAAQLLQQYAVPKHTNCSEDILTRIGYSYLFSSKYLDSFTESYSYTVADSQGIQLFSQGTPPAGSRSFTFSSTVLFPILVTDSALADMLYGTNYGNTYEYTFYDGSTQMFRDYESPVYTLTLMADPEALLETDGSSLTMIFMVYSLRYSFIVFLIAGLLLFSMGAVYLCCAAGRDRRTEGIQPGGLNRLPLDLYLLIAGSICFGAIALTVPLVESWYYKGADFNFILLTLALLILYVGALSGVGFCYACAAQFKCRNGMWWRHSVLGWMGLQLLRLLRLAFRFISKLFSLLPVIWKWLLVAAGMGLSLFFSLIIAFNSYIPGLLLLVLAGCLAIVLYGGYAYGTLLMGAKRMAEGNLGNKINTRFLFGSYATCAQHLNALADAAVLAAQRQLKSERMKTELITNVSHDIKTPLTSIINYVDLLAKPHTPQEEQQYLEVLGRQSQRMKRLIEDLMDMSKATTGNMAVEITQVDAVEAVNQALGEFADKLAAASLTPVFRSPEASVAVLADGRLTWRVLSNLLSNTVKYALPGTRVYIDLVRQGSQVVLSVKNISREELNVSADELTERFVRGDVSRNTEGSGLGLNIAQSLMELQKGRLELLVDGDLFKVTLRFPCP